MEDAPAVQKAIADEAVVRSLASVPWPYALADAEAFLARDRDPLEPSLLILLRCARGDPELIGGIGIGRRSEGGLELGYWLARAHWGRGYATEAGLAVIAGARDSLRLERLVSGHFLDNPASGRVLEKLGFRPTGATAVRYSAGRRAEVACRELVLDLGSAGAEAEPCSAAGA
jgi:RimJ/RimL family protein N-acetyltransferase